MMKLLFSLCWLVLLGTSVSAQEPSVSSIINRARATVGSERVLDDLVTLQMVGKLEPVDSTMPAANVLIIARKPCSQRMEIKLDDIVETTLMSAGEGALVRSNLAEGASKMRMLSQPELDRVAYSTRQFFSFYRPEFKRGERVSHAGVELRQGVRCNQLHYAYPDGLTTRRYFSVETDQLISTVTENGVEIVPRGLQTEQGIRFPQRVDYYEGDTKLHSITLTKVIVNKPLPEGIFDLPKVEEK